MENGIFSFWVFGKMLYSQKLFDLSMCDLRLVLEEDCEENGGILIECFCLLPIRENPKT